MRVPTLAPARDLGSVIFKLVSIHAVLIHTIFHVQKVDGQRRKTPLARAGEGPNSDAGSRLAEYETQLTLKIEGLTVSRLTSVIVSILFIIAK
jgi:hypothetical protein